MKKFRNIYLSMIVVLILTLGLGCVMVYAHGSDSGKNSEVEIYYTSIQIQQGDTLWSIAEQYHTSMNMDIEEYIKEVKSLNHLNTNTIHIDHYLLIPYGETTSI